uniref:Ig-like domain-containing protein n=1 Tax=Paramormyrops kingsleyae TaxID=1676925 RepID=A0A3B3QMY8_9TELE
GQTVPPTSPTVSLVTLPIGESRVDALMCVIQDFHPKSVSVTWKAGDRTVSGQTWESEKGQTGLYSASSLLKLDSSVWESDTVYTCEVQHGANKTTKTISKDCSHCN